MCFFAFVPFLRIFKFCLFSHVFFWIFVLQISRFFSNFCKKCSIGVVVYDSKYKICLLVNLVVDSEMSNEDNEFIWSHPLVNDYSIGLSPPNFKTFLSIIGLPSNKIHTVNFSDIISWQNTEFIIDHECIQLFIHDHRSRPAWGQRIRRCNYCSGCLERNLTSSFFFDIGILIQNHCTNHYKCSYKPESSVYLYSLSQNCFLPIYAYLYESLSTSKTTALSSSLSLFCRKLNASYSLAAGLTRIKSIIGFQ